MIEFPYRQAAGAAGTVTVQKPAVVIREALLRRRGAAPTKTPAPARGRGMTEENRRRNLSGVKAGRRLRTPPVAGISSRARISPGGRSTRCRPPPGHLDVGDEHRLVASRLKSCATRSRGWCRPSRPNASYGRQSEVFTWSRLAPWPRRDRARARRTSQRRRLRPRSPLLRFRHAPIKL